MIAVVILLALLNGCAPKVASGGQSTITAAGSTSVQPFAEILAEDYGGKHPGETVNVQGGGSSAGVEAAQTGAAEIGMLSRYLKGNEKTLKENVIAYDAIAMVIHPTNSVAGLTKQQVARIFSGQSTNWKECGGPDHPIHVVSREEGSGTRSSFDDMILGKLEVTQWAMVQDSNGAVRETVAGDRYAIGYISLGLVDQRVKAVAIDGIQPSVQTVKSKQYGIVRPFLMVTKTEPIGLTKSFLDFVLSPAGQRMLANEGLVPVR
jgi:phosphate transport system substrate-binding protein